jgi:hypothetical protein
MMNLTLAQNCDSVEIIEGSAVIAQVGYSRSASELYVEFVSGAVYTYTKVPEAVYIEFLNAESRGNFLNTEITPVYDGYLLEEI